MLQSTGRHFVRVLGHLFRDLAEALGHFERVSFPEESGFDGADQVVGLAQLVVNTDARARSLGGLLELLEQGVQTLDEREVRHVNGRPRKAQEPQLKQELYKLRVVKLLVGAQLVRTQRLDQGLQFIFIQKRWICIKITKHLCDLGQTDFLDVLVYLIERFLMVFL